MNAQTPQLRHNSVSVIVPVYRNLDVTRHCLESLAASPLPENASVTLIIDDSPEEPLVQYCQEVAARSGYARIENPTNLGFVKTANLGFGLHPDADVLLLNSDTVVAGNWLERLQHCAYSGANVGTVTPFSNNGTICSYPVLNAVNTLPEGWTTAALDAVFAEANSGQHCTLPTAVGFCMYIKRACLEQTGEFDAEKFGLGYGEECDFCLRASQHGWQHLLCGDVFVYHEGGASFSDESERRKREADQIIAALHPTYDDQVSTFLVEDPAWQLRQQVDIERVNRQPSDLTRVMEEHRTFQDSLRTMISDEQKKTRQVRLEVDALQGMIDKLEALLRDSRAEFAEADARLATTQAALNEAHTGIDTLSTNFRNLQQEARELLDRVDTLSSQLDTTGAQLHASRDEVASLSARLEQMLNSRSWRYTRWLRKED